MIALNLTKKFGDTQFPVIVRRILYLHVRQLVATCSY